MSSSRHDQPAPSSRRRGVFWAVLLPIVCILAGLLFTTSAHLTRQGELREEPRDLADLIRAEDKQVEARLRLVRELKAEIAQLELEAEPGTSALKKMELESTRLAPAVGTQAVSGPAVRVSLDDSPLTLEEAPEGMTANDLVIHQSDVQNVINALWSGGAEAMMVMDQRVTNESAVRCVGNSLILHGRVYSPPFTITAIGDVDALQDSLDADPQVRIYRDYVDQLGLGYTVEVIDSMRLPEYTGPVALTHAKAASSEGTHP